MREHEMERSRQAPRNTHPIVLWLLFALAVAGVWLLATMPAEVLISSSEPAVRDWSAERPRSQPTPAVGMARELTAMGD